ncbi:MAG: TIGR02186 family protein [Desulfobacteraceae bacterium]|nr:TIGR02186 family protein [Desulfobacteraceae bacterium]
MKPQKCFSKLVLCMPATLFLVLISLPLYATSSKFLVKPDLVRIRALYNGTRVNVSAEIPRGCDVIVEVMGRDIEEAVVQKVRRLGLWMNGEEIVVRGAPSIYLAMSSEPAMLTSPSVAALWGYKALKKRVSFSGHIKETENNKIFEEFLQLKESLQLYGVFPGALEVSSSSGHRSAVQGSFELPSNVTPGNYHVTLSVIQKGAMLFRESVPLKVVMVGFPELVYRMAKKHAVAYGFLCIAIAALAGLFVGLVFAKSRPHEE